MELREGVHKTLLKDIGPIFCINLPHRTARKQNMQMLFDILGVLDDVKFVNGVISPTRNGEHGCFLAHQKAMTLALQDPECKSAVIFEDDVELSSEVTETIVKQIKQTLSMKKRLDVLYLGCCPDINFYHNPVFRNQQESMCLKWTHATQTHAYIASRSWMEYVVKLDYEMLQIPIDKVFWMSNYTIGVFPSIFAQSITSSSDVSSLSLTVRGFGEAWNAFKNIYVSKTNVSFRLVLVALAFVIFLWILCSL